ncbi:MAG: host attachment protein [Myxococcota bacterium]
MGRIWVLVGNAGGVRIFGGRSGGDLQVIGELDNPTVKSVANVRRSGRRSVTLAPIDSPVERFAEHLGTLLAEAKGAGRFDQLVFVAPSDFLAVLQRRLDRNVAASIVATVEREAIPATNDLLMDVAREALQEAAPAPA